MAANTRSISTFHPTPSIPDQNNDVEHSIEQDCKLSNTRRDTENKGNILENQRGSVTHGYCC